MTLKEYCKDHKITARHISEDCGIPYSTVNDLMNGKTELRRTSFGVISDIADFLGLDLDEFRSMFEERHQNLGEAELDLIVRNKRYLLLWEGKRVDLCKASLLNKAYIADIAGWTLSDLKEQEELEKQDALLSDARG